MINARSGYDAILMNMSTSYSPNLNTYISTGNMSNYNNDEMKTIYEYSKKEKFISI